MLVWFELLDKPKKTKKKNKERSLIHVTDTRALNKNTQNVISIQWDRYQTWKFQISSTLLTKGGLKISNWPIPFLSGQSIVCEIFQNLILPLFFIFLQSGFSSRLISRHHFLHRFFFWGLLANWLVLFGRLKINKRSFPAE